jgi:hypothetical protein
MADDSNDTQSKIDEEDSHLRKKERQLDPESRDRDKFADGGSGFIPDRDTGDGSFGGVGSAGEDNEYGARVSEEERAEEEERSS